MNILRARETKILNFKSAKSWLYFFFVRGARALLKPSSQACRHTSASALPALANCDGLCGAAGNGPGTTAKYLRQTASGAAGSGLSATIKYLGRTTSGSSGYGLGTTIKYLLGAPRAPLREVAWAPRSNTCAAPRASAWAPRSSTCDAQRAPPRAAARHRGQVPATHNERRREQQPGQRPSTCDAKRAMPQAAAWASRSSTCAAPKASTWAPRSSTCAAPRASALTPR
jgi:hypothetical protein